MTTLAKAKAVQPIIEKLISKAKKGAETHRRQVLAVLPERTLVAKLFIDGKTRFGSRTSGFTRIIKAGLRQGDATQTAILSFVDDKVVAPKSPKKGKKT